jgi:hypothetical protein
MRDLPLLNALLFQKSNENGRAFHDCAASKKKPRTGRRGFSRTVRNTDRNGGSGREHNTYPALTVHVEPASSVGSNPVPTRSAMTERCASSRQHGRNIKLVLAKGQAAPRSSFYARSPAPCGSGLLLSERPNVRASRALIWLEIAKRSSQFNEQALYMAEQWFTLAFLVQPTTGCMSMGLLAKMENGRPLDAG